MPPGQRFLTVSRRSSAQTSPALPTSDSATTTLAASCHTALGAFGVKAPSCASLPQPSFDQIVGCSEDALRDLHSELLRSLEIDREANAPSTRVRDLGGRLPGQDAVRQFARLAADVLATRERQRQEGAHLRL